MTKQKQDKPKSILGKVKSFLFTPEYSLRNVILSVVLGFVIAYLILLSLYGFEGSKHIMFSLFEQDFLNSNTMASLLSKVVVLGLAGIGIAFGMKAGILNIGVSGQMTAGGLIGFILVNKLGFFHDPSNKSITLAIMFFVVVIVAMLTAVLSGVLKVFFKVNEVISTIMINWIVVYFVKLNTNNAKGDAMGISDGGGFSSTFFTSGNVWTYAIIGFAILVISAIAAWVFLTKSRSGFKLIATGKNLDAANYAGYNSKMLVLTSFAISGMFAGFAGFVMFFLSYNSIPGAEAPLQEGFMGIAVALVGMLNPLAIIPSAILFGLLSGPIDGIVVAGFAPDVVLVFSGVITYFVAITTLFLYLRPIDIVRSRMRFYKERREDKAESQRNLKVAVTTKKVKATKKKGGK